MLTTLLPIDGGSATVAGLDVRRQPGQVRGRIGYVSQLGGADELATGRENLTLQGRLYGQSRADVARRVAGGARAVRPGRVRGPAGADLLGRPAAAPRRGARGRARTRGPVPGRAEHRAGSAEPGQPVGPHPQPAGPGHHRLPDHPLPGRSRRALRPHHDHRPWGGGGRRYPACAQAPGRGRRDRAGHPRRRRCRARRRGAGRAARRARPHPGGPGGPAVRQRRRGRAARDAPAARPGGPAGPLAPAVRAEPG